MEIVGIRVGIFNNHGYGLVQSAMKLISSFYFTF